MTYKPASRFNTRLSRRTLVLGGATAAAMVRGALAAPSKAVDWSQWRGPGGAGIAEGQNLPVRWSRTEHVAWAAPLPGWGTGSPVVFQDRIFVTSQAIEGERKSLLTLCFHRKDGRELWRLLPAHVPTFGPAGL